MFESQKGQVLPLGLALLLFGVLGAFVVFNTGQVATDKMKLANTADAAAYSGTLWQARALNFQSYSNRAMVANQVSIAQAVTLQSWVSYGAVTSGNLATVLDPVPVINVIANGLQRGLDVVARLVGPVSQSIVTVVDIVNRGLSMAQEAMFVSTFVATPDVVRQVVSETDERFTINTGFSGLGLANNLHDWQAFTDGFSDDDEMAMTEREQLINASRDDFTRDRNWKFFNFWFYSTPITRHRIHREGDTRLIRVNTEQGMEWEWKAKDTMSLHNRIWHWKGTKRIEVPIGWAEAFANSAQSDRTIEPGACTTVSEMRIRGRDCARFLRTNRWAEYGADLGLKGLGSSKGSNVETLTAMKNYTGVQAFRSLSQAKIEEDRPHLTLKVEVALPAAQTVSTASLGSTDRFEQAVVTPGELVSSVSVAEVYYKRPDAELLRAQGDLNRSLERANGYNPYWDSRLSPVSGADRMLAFALRPGATSGSTPDALPDNSVQLAGYTESVGSANTDFYGAGVASQGSQALEDFDQVAAQYGRENLSSLKDDLQRELNDAFESALRDMLSAAVSRSLGGGNASVDALEDELNAAMEQGVDNFAGDAIADEMTELVQTAETLAAELEAEFRRIRTAIVTAFETAFTDAVAELNAEIAEITEKIVDIRRRIETSALGPDAIADEERKILAYHVAIGELRASLQDDLSHELVRIVSETTDMYVMPFREASYVVGEFLKLDEEERAEGITLPWLEVIDDDDVD